jgi:hypothetical protein
VSEWLATFVPVTAALASLALVTAPFFSCLVPTLLASSYLPRINDSG